MSQQQDEMIESLTTRARAAEKRCVELERQIERERGGHRQSAKLQSEALSAYEARELEALAKLAETTGDLKAAMERISELEGALHNTRYVAEIKP